MKIFSVGIITAAFITSFLSATTINIPADYTTIQAGIDAAVDGDTVLVQSGTYVENINFNGKNIVVGSLYLTTSDTSYISSTIIDGNESGSTVTMLSTSSIAEFVGFNVINGSSAAGGGLEINGNGSKIRGVVVRNNTASSGAGVMISGGTPEFDNVKIINNIATGNYGGGIYFTGGNAVFINSVISGNTGASNGGGVACFDSNPVFTNVLIHSNSANKGGGILCEFNSAPILTNVTIANNHASQGGGSLYSRADAIISVNNSILWSVNSSEIETETGGTVSISYSNVKNGYTGTGNINSDPLLYDATNGDYRLSDYSPCIGAGLDTSIVPSTDIEGNPRPNPPGSNPDMGAYENILGIPITAEVEDLYIGDNEDLQHLITHTPTITFGFYDSMSEPQTHYQVQVTTQSDFSSADMWDSGEVASSDTAVTYAGAALENGTTYYLRVKVAAGSFWSDWSSLTFRMNTEPSTPIKISPIANEVSGIPVVLKVMNSTDAESDAITYSFNIYSDANLTTKLDSATAVTEGTDTTSWQVTATLPDNGQYWWKASANDGYEESTISASASFLLNATNDIPASFTLLTPVDSSDVTTFTSFLDWEPAFDPDPMDTVRYTIYYGNTIPALQIISVDTATSYQVSNPLIDNTTYYWKVTAIDLSGATTENTGGYWSFRVNLGNEPPSQVTLVAPIEGSIQTNLQPHFYWTEANDPDPQDSISYTLNWWPVSVLPVIYSVSIDTNSYIPTDSLTDNSLFMWFVEATDQYDSASTSDTSHFYTDAFPEPPLAFNTISPIDSSDGLLTEVEFIWHSTTDPDPLDQIKYNLVYATDWTNSSTFVWVENIPDTTVSLALQDNTEYFWIVEAVDKDTLITASNNGTPKQFVVGIILSTDVKDLIPEEFALHQNYPNPFNPVTTLRYDLPERAHVMLTIYDILGRQVKTMVYDVQEPGFKSVIWDATNDRGQSVGAGVYLYRIQARQKDSGQAGDYLQTKKMVLLK